MKKNLFVYQNDLLICQIVLLRRHRLLSFADRKHFVKWKAQLLPYWESHCLCFQLTFVACRLSVLCSTERNMFELIFGYFLKRLSMQQKHDWQWSFWKPFEEKLLWFPSTSSWLLCCHFYYFSMHKRKEIFLPISVYNSPLCNTRNVGSLMLFCFRFSCFCVF